MLSDQKLEALFTEPESDRIERRPSLSQREEIRKSICAFSNDLPGSGQAGVIFISLEDKGHCSKFPITDESLRTFSDMCSDGNILPPPVFDIRKVTLKGCEVAVVVVMPADNPLVRFKGTV